MTISADGRYVAFISCGNTLVPSLANPYEYYTAYLHDTNTGQTSALAADPKNNVIPVGEIGTLSALTVDLYLSEELSSKIGQPAEISPFSMLPLTDLAEMALHTLRPLQWMEAVQSSLPSSTNLRFK